MNFFTDNAAAIALVLAGLCLLGIIMLQVREVARLRQRIDDLTGGVDGGDLESVLGQHLETVHQVGRDLDEITARMAIVESSARHHFSREGLIRFNPFPDTGGNQSFALALLDESDDGVVVSSLHSRTGTRIYAKAVLGGKADTSLSSEEQEAIDEARAKRTARPATPPRSAAASRPTPVGAERPSEEAVGPRSAAAAAPTAARPAPSIAARSARPAPVEPPPAPVPFDDQSERVVVAPTAKAPQPAPAEMAEEMTSRPSSQRTKGQTKPTDLLEPDIAAAADSERVERKPGQSAPRPGSR